MLQLALDHNMKIFLFTHCLGEREKKMPKSAFASTMLTVGDLKLSWFWLRKTNENINSNYFCHICPNVPLIAQDIENEQETEQTRVVQSVVPWLCKQHVLTFNVYRSFWSMRTIDNSSDLWIKSSMGTGKWVMGK